MCVYSLDHSGAFLFYGHLGNPGTSYVVSASIKEESGSFLCYTIILISFFIGLFLL
jgi:hypothetical protein